MSRRDMMWQRILRLVLKLASWIVHNTDAYTVTEIISTTMILSYGTMFIGSHFIKTFKTLSLSLDVTLVSIQPSVSWANNRSSWSYRWLRRGFKMWPSRVFEYSLRRVMQAGIQRLQEVVHCTSRKDYSGIQSASQLLSQKLFRLGCDTT